MIGRDVIPTPIERVARAICLSDITDGIREGYVDDIWTNYIDNAKAAIAAMMEPSERMLDASWHAAGESKQMRARTHAHYKRHYAYMLQAALDEG